MKKLALFVAPLLVILTACGGSSVKVNNLNADGFASDIQNPGVVVLDVRTAGEFASGHIENAINIDVESTTFDSEIAKTRQWNMQSIAIATADQ
jgi:predicted sulfurtransferase